MCTHDRAALVGTARGVECRACGKVWDTYAEYEAETSPKPAEEPAKEPKEAPKRGRKKKGD